MAGADLTMTLDDAAAAIQREAEVACVRVKNVAQDAVFRLELADKGRAVVAEAGGKPLDFDGADAMVVHEFDQLAGFSSVTLILSGIMQQLDLARPQAAGKYQLTFVLRKIRPVER